MLNQYNPMKPNLVLILVYGRNILIMGASQYPASEIELTYENTIA